MTFSPSTTDCLLGIYMALGQYPILRNRVRLRMQRELFERSIVDPNAFEAEVREKAILSQQREGLVIPYQEPAEIWDLRTARVRNQLTDLYFSQHFIFGEFEKILYEVLSERGIEDRDIRLSMNPEMAPLEMVFEQAITIESLPAEERSRYEARLQESKVVLIRNLISDQLRYINIAKEWFTIQDLAEIRRRKIGSGRIGGKAAGMLLALRIIDNQMDPTLRGCVSSPESYFIGSDEFYAFMSINNLHHWNDQKYKTEEQMREDFPEIARNFSVGEFPPDITEKLRTLLINVGKQPMIVRSSSLLEDNFGMSFAGKYESIFLPNQGSVDENLEAFIKGIIEVYVSAFHPKVLLYRRQKGLQDYDERMAVLIQVVEGERFGKYFLPHAAGVAFSRNQYRWAPQIRYEDGFVRLVWGLGTRAVDRVGNDFPRLVALSHPLLRPSSDPKSVRRYSQHYVDLIDLEENEFKTLPIHKVLNAGYPPLRYLAQLDEGEYFSTLRTGMIDGDPRQLVLTMDEILRRTPFAVRMREILRVLEQHYHGPVDMEFTAHLSDLDAGRAHLCFTILQCRPQSHLAETTLTEIPSDLPPDDIILSTQFVVPRGRIERVDYVVFVTPEGYYSLPSMSDRTDLARAIGHLNKALEKELFICAGPGRWGSSNSDLGVPIDYSDIYNAKSLVELSGQGIALEPEPSLGTHFFQDLLEAQIFPLAVYIGQPTAVFNKSFFYDTPNCLLDFIQANELIAKCLHLVRVSDFRPDHHITVVMNDEKVQAVAYLEKNIS